MEPVPDRAGRTEKYEMICTCKAYPVGFLCKTMLEPIEYPPPALNAQIPSKIENETTRDVNMNRENLENGGNIESQKGLSTKNKSKKPRVSSQPSIKADAKSVSEVQSKGTTKLPLTKKIRNEPLSPVTVGGNLRTGCENWKPSIQRVFGGPDWILIDEYPKPNFENEPKECLYYREHRKEKLINKYSKYPTLLPSTPCCQSACMADCARFKKLTEDTRLSKTCRGYETPETKPSDYVCYQKNITQTPSFIRRRRSFSECNYSPANLIPIHNQNICEFSKIMQCTSKCEKEPSSKPSYCILRQKNSTTNDSKYCQGLYKSSFQ